MKFTTHWLLMSVVLQFLMGDFQSIPAPFLAEKLPKTKSGRIKLQTEKTRIAKAKIRTSFFRIIAVTLPRVELGIFSLGVRRSIQLSYRVQFLLTL